MHYGHYSEAPSPKPTHKLKVVATIFPQYDFLRAIGKNRIDLQMLIKPGQEVHTFEPSPQDIIAIQNCNLFVYVGGDSDNWAERILKANPNKNRRSIALIDCVPTLSEQHKSEMTLPYLSEEEEEEPDEHVWTSPQNVILIVQKLTAVLCAEDPKNANFYRKNADAYIKKLQNLNAEFVSLMQKSKRHEIIVGDRFPFLYFTHAYHLTYYAAFPGCSSATEANAATIAALCQRVKKDHIPVVFHIEMSNQKIADIISENTGAKVLLLHSVHNLTARDFANGATYLSIMQNNLNALKEALN